MEQKLVSWRTLTFTSSFLVFFFFFRAFYNKLGAHVQKGLMTSRFVGKALEDVAELPLADEF